MARLNTPVKREPVKTHEGATAVRTSKELQLRRSVMACMLWEDSFYESGKRIASRIETLCQEVPAERVELIAQEAREQMKLRHVPLLLASALASLGRLSATGLANVIQRPDELTEFLAIFCRDRTGPKKLNKLPNQIKKGLALAFQKFNAYSLAKYNRDGEFKLRDVLFICHAKPQNKEQAEVWKKLVDGTLETPDTWEVALSASKGQGKKDEWERLLSENKLGALALLRNLRNMTQCGVDKNLISTALAKADISRVLPFRFIAAAKAAPRLEDKIEKRFLDCAGQMPKLRGKTILVVDISGSMHGAGNISKHSDMTRLQAAGALAAIAREQCEDVSVYATAGDDYRRVHATALVPARHGFALVDLFQNKELNHKLGGGGIFLKQCLDYIYEQEKSADRIIVFTDEHDCDTKCNPATANAFGKANYLVNISVEKNGIGYKPKWTHIDGFSEAILSYIVAAENQFDFNAVETVD